MRETQRPLLRTVIYRCSVLCSMFVVASFIYYGARLAPYTKAMVYDIVPRVSEYLSSARSGDKLGGHHFKSRYVPTLHISLMFFAPRRDAIDMSARGPDLELVHATPVHGTPTWRFNGIETN